MDRALCLFAAFTVLVGVVHSWEKAILKSPHEIFFYDADNKIISTVHGKGIINNFAHDPLHRNLYYVESSIHKDVICRINLDSIDSDPECIFWDGHQAGYKIYNLAVDPIRGRLYYSDYESESIFYVCLAPSEYDDKCAFMNDTHIFRLVDLRHSKPHAVAVDQCRGKVFWSNRQIPTPSIESIQFEKSERKVIAEAEVDSLAVDPRTKTLYWMDVNKRTIESSDYEGKSRNSVPASGYVINQYIAQNKDSIFWCDYQGKTIWKLPKNFKNGAKPESYLTLDYNPVNIIINYSLNDETEEVPECETLRNLANN